MGCSPVRGVVGGLSQAEAGATYARLDGTNQPFTGGIVAPDFNGVALTTAGSATNFLNAEGNYVTTGGAGSQDLQSVTDLGATTDIPITQTPDVALTYTTGKLTNITYSDGTEKDLAYNMDGTLNTLTITYPAATPIVKTLTWSSGVLQGIAVT